MENINLNKYKEIWKMESDKIYGNKKLSESEINSFLKGKSKDMSRLFKVGLNFDIFLKILYTFC